MKLLMIIFSTLMWSTNVDCQCYDLIKQYFECKYLNMSIRNNTWQMLDYLPDSSKPNNYLSDRVYKRYLNKMNFNEAMQLFQKIYKITENCSTEFCKCVAWKHIDKNIKYSIFFRNETNFKQVKKILLSFNLRFKDDILPFKQLEHMYMYDGPPGDWPLYPSLTKFCIKYDYSRTRLGFYNFNSSCDNPNYSYEVIFF